MRVGIVGCGAIGSEVAKAASSMDGVEAVVIHDIDPDATALLADLERTTIVDDVTTLLDEVDLLVECANKAVVQGPVRDALAAGKSVMILTVGALGDNGLREELLALARKNGSKIYIPSGAVMGIDGVRAAKTTGLKSVTLVTTKPPAGLDEEVTKWTLLFTGPAREAIQKFPKNVNVAAALSLAGLGFDDTLVQVAVDPLATRNSHKVIIEGGFGRARIEVENLPSPGNPRTSFLASASAISLLQRIVGPLEIGA